MSVISKLAAAGVLGLCSLAGPAIAESGISPLIVRPNSVTVSYADLDVRSASGANVLLQRIQRGAKTVCIENGIMPVKQIMAQRTCYRDAINTAVSTSGLDMLNDVHGAKNIWAVRAESQPVFAANTSGALTITAP